MTTIDVAGEPLPIRPALADAVQDAWQRLTRPGTWWNGEQRRAIALEARHATTCPLCLQRKEALSPYTVDGAHSSLPGSATLGDDAIEAIHRLRTDAGRITEQWVQQITSGALSEEAYVEIIGIVAVLTALDTFDQTLGRELQPIPAAQPGEPRRHRPAGARKDIAWVSTLSPDTAQPDDPDPFVHGKAYIHHGLSLVPQEVFNFFDLDVELYIHDTQIRDFTADTRAINRAQIELVAGRASAINNCTY
jgi:alkylhydroperoxidase family enzyme